MRLWHEDLINKLPRQQLLGQWRECIALLGNGWGKKHSTVDYVFKYPQERLCAFTIKVGKEMKKRGYHPNWKLIPNALEKRNITGWRCWGITLASTLYLNEGLIYPEHNEQYYQECIENLKNKGVDIQ